MHERALASHSPQSDGACACGVATALVFVQWFHAIIDPPPPPLLCPKSPCPHPNTWCRAILPTYKLSSPVAFKLTARRAYERLRRPRQPST